MYNGNIKHIKGGRVPMKNILEQHMLHLKAKEQKLFTEPENSLKKNTIDPLLEKIQSKIPDKLRSTLNTAFYKGFQLVFEKGSPYIEKTYDKDKLQVDFDVNDYAVDKHTSKRHMKRLDKQASKSQLVNTSLSALEGGILGVLGVGLPDIPLFISVILKTIYEVALSYGFDYTSDQEKTYVLLLISSAMSKGEEQKKNDEELEKLGTLLDNNLMKEVDLTAQMKSTSEVLSDAMLTTKFIQGIPIVGAVGGVANYTILNKITSFARIKYKKRYLNKKLAE